MRSQAEGYHKLVTALYMDGDKYLTSDTVFGVKKSLVVVGVVQHSAKSFNAHGSLIETQDH